MSLNHIIDAITREFGPSDLSINVHPDGMQSIHVPSADSYFTSTDPQALWEAIRRSIRQARRVSTT